MRIAQVAPLAEAVPPKLYGGTERVVSWLTEELVGQGHDVTLFAVRRFGNLGGARPLFAAGPTPPGHPRFRREPRGDAGSGPTPCT